ENEAEQTSDDPDDDAINENGQEAHSDSGVLLLRLSVCLSIPLLLPIWLLRIAGGLAIGRRLLGIPLLFIRRRLLAISRLLSIAGGLAIGRLLSITRLLAVGRWLFIRRLSIGLLLAVLLRFILLTLIWVVRHKVPPNSCTMLRCPAWLV